MNKSNGKKVKNSLQQIEALEAMATQVYINKGFSYNKMISRFKYLFLFIVSLAAAQPLFSQEIPLPANTEAIDTALANYLYSQALQGIERQDFQSAENSLNEVIKADPNHDDARFALIRIYFLQKNIDKAKVLALDGAKLKPNKAMFWEALSDIYKEEENYKEILPVFDQLIRLAPEDIKNYLDKAYTYTLIKDYKKALSAYNKTEKKFGEKESIYSGRIAVYLQQENVKKAIKEANHYVQKHKNESASYLTLASLYLNLKEPDNALKVANEAESKFPDDPYIYLIKAEAYQQLKDNNELLIQLKQAFSIKTFELSKKIQILFNISQDLNPELAVVVSDALCQVLVETHPNEPNAYAVYGDVLIQQNKNQEALVQFKKALEINPKIEIVWENILQLQTLIGDFKNAQKDGLEALSYYPQNPMLLLYTSYAYSSDKKYELARPYLEGALNNADPRNTTLMLQVYSSLGDLYNHLGMDDVSNTAYDEALKIDSNNVYVLNNYAYYLSVRKESLEKAALYSKRSNELLPGNASFQDTYAWVLFQQGNYKEALGWIEKAIKSSTNSSSVLLEHYGDILFKLGKEKEALSNWQDALKISVANGENSDALKRKIENKKYEE